MSPYVIDYKGLTYKTTEHLFQSLRFNDETIVKEINSTNSPIGAKFVAKKHKEKMVIVPRTEADLINMELVLGLKVEQHSELKNKLIELKNSLIIEDVSNRNTKNNRYWGMSLLNGKWVGENNLGKIWMKIVNNL